MEASLAFCLWHFASNGANSLACIILKWLMFIKVSDLIQKEYLQSVVLLLNRNRRKNVVFPLDYRSRLKVLAILIQMINYFVRYFNMLMLIFLLEWGKLCMLIGRNIKGILILQINRMLKKLLLKMTVSILSYVKSEVILMLRFSSYFDFWDSSPDSLCIELTTVSFLCWPCAGIIGVYYLPYLPEFLCKCVPFSSFFKKENLYL